MGTNGPPLSQKIYIANSIGNNYETSLNLGYNRVQLNIYYTVVI